MPASEQYEPILSADLRRLTARCAGEENIEAPRPHPPVSHLLASIQALNPVPPMLCRH